MNIEISNLYFSSLNVGKNINWSKKCYIWTFDVNVRKSFQIVDHQKYRIQFDDSVNSGKKTVKLNDQNVLYKAKLTNFAVEPYTIQQQPFSIKIIKFQKKSSMFKSYDLLIENQQFSLIKEHLGGKYQFSLQDYEEKENQSDIQNYSPDVVYGQPQSTYFPTPNGPEYKEIPQKQEPSLPQEQALPQISKISSANEKLQNAQEGFNFEFLTSVQSQKLPTDLFFDDTQKPSGLQQQHINAPQNPPPKEQNLNDFFSFSTNSNSVQTVDDVQRQRSAVVQNLISLDDFFGKKPEAKPQSPKSQSGNVDTDLLLLDVNIPQPNQQQTPQTLGATGENPQASSQEESKKFYPEPYTTYMTQRNSLQYQSNIGGGMIQHNPAMYQSNIGMLNQFYGQQPQPVQQYQQLINQQMFASNVNQQFQMQHLIKEVHGFQQNQGFDHLHKMRQELEQTKMKNEKLQSQIGNLIKFE